MTPVTPEQSAEIHRLNAEGLDRTAISEKVGVTRRQVDSVLAWIKIRAQPGGETSDEDEIADAIGTRFGLERDLQSALRERIGQLEPGLTVIDGNKERSVPSGRIDITARDRSGVTVVIELKAGEADRDALGQILAYMGDLMTTEKSVRGILIAGDFTPRAIAAARAAESVELLRYDISFSFAPVSAAASS
jgi:hypothetical protein